MALPRFRSLDKWLARPGITKRFILAAMIAAPAGEAMAAGFYNPRAPGVSFWDTVRDFGSADVLGFALFAPLLLALLSRETWDLFPAALSKTAGLIGLLAGGSWLVFHQGTFQVAFIVYPLLLAVGTELGLNGAILAIAMLAVIATQATVGGMGPFGSAAVSPEVRMAELQLYLALSVTMALPVGVARVRRAVHDKAVPHSFSEAGRVTVSFGLACAMPDEGGDPLLLIAISDKALYNAKHRGRNQVSTALDPVEAM